MTVRYGNNAKNGDYFATGGIDLYQETYGQLFNIGDGDDWIFPESRHGAVHRYEFNTKVQHFFTHPYKKAELGRLGAMR